MHRPPQLGLVPAQQSRHPVGPAGGQGPQRRAPDQRRPRPECQRLDHVGGPAHAAVDVDLGPSGHGVDDLGQNVCGRRRIGQLAGPVVGDHDGRRPGLDAAHGVVGPLHALDHDGQRTQSGQPSDVVWSQRRLELVRDDRHEPSFARAARAVAGQVGQRQVVGQVDAETPLSQPEARDGCVDGQDEGPVAVGGGTAHQLLGACPLAQYVDLHPAGRFRRGRSDVLEPAGGERRQDQQRTHLCSAPGGGHLTFGVSQPLNRRRGNDDGRADRGAEQGGGDGNLRDPRQDVRMELPVAPGLHIAPEQALVVGTTCVVGVSHFADGMPGVLLEVIQGKVGDQGCHTTRPDSVMPRDIGPGRMSRHGPHGRRARPRDQPEVQCVSRMPSR